MRKSMIALCVALALAAFCRSSLATAQTTDSIAAKDAYFEAQSLYDKSKYDDALSKLDDAKHLRGSSDAWFQALEVKIFIGLKNHEEANAALDKFHGHNPTNDLRSAMAPFIEQLNKLTADYNAIDPLAAAENYNSRVQKEAPRIVKERLERRVSKSYTGKQSQGVVAKYSDFQFVIYDLSKISGGQVIRGHVKYGVNLTGGIGRDGRKIRMADTYFSNIPFSWNETNGMAVAEVSWSYSKSNGWSVVSKGIVPLIGEGHGYKCYLSAFGNTDESKGQISKDICLYLRQQATFTVSIPYTEAERLARNKNPALFDSYFNP